MKFKQKKNCRCCLGKDLLMYLDLGKQPLANNYHKEGGKQDEVPLEVMLCLNCYHNQLSVVVDPDLMFKNYLYVSGTTKTFRKHTRDLARNAVKRFDNKKLTVLDVACNDGTQLEFFREFKCNVFGVDPAKNLRVITQEKKIPVIVDYWSQKLALKMKNNFDIITATNVFAHVDDVDEFLKASAIALKKNGILILEFPYADNMISHNEFDTVYHEHLSYFLVNSFKNLANRLDFVITDVMRTPIHGGSIRFFLSRGNVKESAKVSKLIAVEEKNGLHSMKTYKKYSDEVSRNKSEMKVLMEKLKKEKKKVIGYGASAKGNTMLNYFKINLAYTIDDNELKWGYLTPGRNIPIKSPADLAIEEKDLYIVILAWNFYNEISKRINLIRGDRKDFTIVYVPKVKINRIKDQKKYIQSA